MAKTKNVKSALVDINKKQLSEEEELLNLIESSEHFIDTKYYPVNLILNGDLFKGLNRGQFYMFGGKPQSGKSFTAELIAHQIHDEYDSKIRWFDVENAFGDGYQDERDVVAKGFDPNRFELVKLPEEHEMWTVENFGVVCDEIMDKILEEQTDKKNENYNPDRVNLVVLDSLNSLPINKEAKDVKKADAGQDMGQKSKIIQRVFKPLIQKAYKTKTIFIIINQVYEVPSLFPGQLPKFSGGNFTQFMASRMILFMTYDNKNEDSTITNRKYESNRLCLLAFKNRKIIKGMFVNALLDYDKGFHRFWDICSLIPKVYEPTAKKDNTRYMFHEWKLYNEDEQKEKIQSQLELSELNDMFEFEKLKKIETIVDYVDGKEVKYNYYAVSSEFDEDIKDKGSKKLVLLDDLKTEHKTDKTLLNKDEKYKKIIESEKYSIIRFTDELVADFNDIETVKTVEFKDSSYCAEDEFQELKWNYFKVKSTKTKIGKQKNLKLIEPKADKLQQFDKDYVASHEFESLDLSNSCVVRMDTTEVKMKDMYKKNGTEYFTRALLEKLNPFFNDAMLYKNEKKDFLMDDEKDFFDDL